MVTTSIHAITHLVRRRLQTMSAGELAWRAAGRLRDAELWGHLALRLEPTLRASDPADADACADPGFRVCDLRVGAWAVPERDEERQWSDRLLAHAEQVAHPGSASSQEGTAIGALRSRGHHNVAVAPRRSSPYRAAELG